MDCNKNETNEIKTDGENLHVSIETNNNFEPSKETSSSGGGDVDSTQSDGAKASESREERIKRLKDKSEAERLRKYTEIIESQKQSSELRQKQQEDRRKKIEELKQREEERKKKVEQRRFEMEMKEKEKNEGLLRRTKEREARAAFMQKHIKMTAAMTQSMTSPSQNRMTASIHSSGASSGSEKCTKVYNRSLSGCEADLVSSYVSRVAGCKHKSRSTGRKLPRVPDGFIEVDGHFIPANTRHAGCFVPFKGPPLHRVKGVLSWGPPPDRSVVSDRGSSVSWWAGIGEQQHRAASSALLHPRGCSVRTHESTPQNLHKISLEDDLTVDIDITHCKTERSVSDAAQKFKGPLSVKMIKTMSLRYLGPSSKSSKLCNGKESMSPRMSNRSSSHQKAADSSVNTPKPRTPRAALVDQSLYDRLSKPRGGSQPPKDNRNNKETIFTPTNIMSSSFTKQPSKVATKTPSSSATVKKTVTPVSAPDKKTCPPPPAPTAPTAAAVTVQKKKKEKKPPSVSASDSGLTASPANEAESAKDTDLSEVSTAVIDLLEEANTTKNSPRKQSKNLLNKEVDIVNGSEMSSETKTVAQPILKEEETYRLKLAEQRRLAREAKEKLQEEQRKVEEEAKQKAIAEKLRFEEETRQLIEEEARRVKQLEEEELAEIERQRIGEELDRQKKEEMEKELEEKRQEKSRLDDSDRMERKRRLEKIMSRVKKAEESSSLSNEESSVAMNSELMNTSVTKDDDHDKPLFEISLGEKVNVEEGDDEGQFVVPPQQPIEAWKAEDGEVSDSELPREDCHMSSRGSPSLLSEVVLNLPAPEATSSVSQSPLSTAAEQQQAPLFKSRLLQSMLGSGRLANNNNNNNNSDGGRRNSLVLTNSNPSLSRGGDSETRLKRKSLITNQINGGDIDDSCLTHSRSYNCDIGKMSVSMIDCDQSRNGLSRDESDVRQGRQRCDTAVDSEQSTELHSDSSCSRLVVVEERPSTLSPSRPLELS